FRTCTAFLEEKDADGTFDFGLVGRFAVVFDGFKRKPRNLERPRGAYDAASNLHEQACYFRLPRASSGSLELGEPRLHQRGPVGIVSEFKARLPLEDHAPTMPEGQFLFGGIADQLVRQKPHRRPVAASLVYRSRHRKRRRYSVRMSMLFGERHGLGRLLS